MSEALASPKSPEPSAGLGSASRLPRVVTGVNAKQHIPSSPLPLTAAKIPPVGWEVRSEKTSSTT